MSHAYRLHYVPDNASMIVRLALIELGQSFDCVLLRRDEGEHKAAPYLKLNPAGRIPALETPDGVMFETGAILLWLADKHGDLFPASPSPDRAAALKWLFYVSNTLHANLNLRFYPDQFTASDQKALREGAVRNIRHSFSLLEQVANTRPYWLNGENLSLLDLYVCATLRWAQIYPSKDFGQISAADWPALHALTKRVETRDSVSTVAKAEGLGATPFSNPSKFLCEQHVIT